MITPEEMKQIQNGGYNTSSFYEEDDDDEDDDDEEIYGKPSKKKRRRRDEEDEDDEEDEEDDDERGGVNTKLEKAMTIGGLIIGGIIICILIYMVASAAGLVSLGSKKDNDADTQKEQAQDATDETVNKVTVPDLTGKTEEEAGTELNAQNLGKKKAEKKLLIL